MMRRGCKGMTSSEIESAVDRLGGEIGFDVGPSTISLHGQVIRRNLQPFCELIAKVLGTPTFDQEELDRLKRETVAELIDDARQRSRARGPRLPARALRRSPVLAQRRGPSGRRVEKLTRDDVLATYAKRFVQSDIVIGFAGAITEDEAKTLGALLVRAVPEGPQRREPAARAGSSRRAAPLLRRQARAHADADPHRHARHARRAIADHWPLVAATAVFGGTFTSRMMREIRSKRGWSYGTSARLSIERKRHAFTMGAFPAAADCAPCVALELKLLEDFAKDGITPRELAFIKNYMIRSHAFEIDTAPKRLGQALEAELLDLPADYHTGYLDHVRAVTLESANAAVRAAPHAERTSWSSSSAPRGDILDKVSAAIPGLVEHKVIPFDQD